MREQRSGPVEVYASDTAMAPPNSPLIPSIVYEQIVPDQATPGADIYVGAASADYIIDVAPQGAGIGSSVCDSSTVKLETGADYK